MGVGYIFNSSVTKNRAQLHCIHNYHQTQKNRYPIRDSGFSFCQGKGLEQSNAARRSAAGEGWTEPNFYLLPTGADANESLSAYRKILEVSPSYRHFFLDHNIHYKSV